MRTNFYDRRLDLEGCLPVNRLSAGALCATRCNFGNSSTNLLLQNIANNNQKGTSGQFSGIQTSQATGAGSRSVSGGGNLNSVTGGGNNSSVSVVNNNLDADVAIYALQTNALNTANFLTSFTNIVASYTAPQPAPAVVNNAPTGIPIDPAHEPVNYSDVSQDASSGGFSSLTTMQWVLIGGAVVVAIYFLKR